MTLAEIYEAQLPWVLQTLRRLGVRDPDVDDVAHDLFLVVHRKLVNFDRSRPIRPWLFGVAYRIVRDYLRAAGRRDRRVALVPVPTPELESQAAARHQLTRIQRALDSLEPERRAAFIMFELDGFSVPEIAEALDCRVNTLYSHLRRARIALHAQLSAHTREEARCEQA